jgi:hypothetical protein
MGPFLTNTGPLSGSFTVGQVTGGAVPLLDPTDVSNEEFTKALTLSLRANHLLAEDSLAAKYRIDAALDYDRSGIFDKQVDTKVDYRLVSNRTDAALWETTIQSTATNKSLLKEKAGVVIALLFTSRSENLGEWEATALASARQNLTKFFDALSTWAPPDDAAKGANNYYDSPANVTPVPAVASAAPAAHDATQPTPSIAAGPGSAAKVNTPAAAQAPLTVASAEAPKKTSAPPPNAAISPTSTATTPPHPASGSWTAKIHWIPSLLAPRFSGTGESMLAYDVALTNGSIDADKLNIASDKSNITGTVAGPTIELNGWYKDPWGYVNSVQGSLTENGGAFTGQETCYNTQLAASGPSSQATRHYCNVELSRVP